MARNYKKESQWRDDKYIRFEASVDRQTYGNILDRIKCIGNAKWLRMALGLFERKPELWEKEEQDGKFED